MSRYHLRKFGSVVSLFFLIFVCGCRRDVDRDRVEREIIVGDGVRIDATIYFFPACLKTEEIFDERVSWIRKTIGDLRQEMNATASPKVKEGIEEAIDAYEKGCFFAGSWPRWPIVMVFPVFQDAPLGSKVVVIGRYDKKKALDIALTMSAERGATGKEFLCAATKAFQEVATWEDDEWKKIRLEATTIFDAKGDVISHSLKQFTENATFLQQR